MLSYQHGFHAGNFADLHKHITLQMMLNSLNRKAKPWSYLETHSGRGLYDLSSEQAQKTGEFKEGIAKLWGKPQLGAIEDYLVQIRAVSTDYGEPGELLSLYPGSPMLTAMQMRENDKAHLMELHPKEVSELKRCMRRFANVGVHHRDGYEGVLSMLPPKPNRGLILIDPAYEVKDEYAEVARFVEQAIKRWPNAQIAIWYPMLAAARHELMLKQISRINSEVGLYDSRFIVDELTERGMFGSGMLLVNPPWKIDQDLESLLPKVIKQLSAVSPKIESHWLRHAS